MQELIDPAVVERVMLFLAVGGPLVGLIIGVVVGAHERCALPTIAAGTLIGAMGSVAYGLWRLYGVVTDAMGLDSVANLVVQLVTFAVIGVLLGMAALRLTVLLKKRA